MELLTCGGTAEIQEVPWSFGGVLLRCCAALTPGILLLVPSELSTLPFEELDNRRHARGPLFLDTNIPQV